ncbi:MAG TPA: hypothetical protein VHZ02_03570 [Acidimicrobiales bacterium]|jgi:hypothetical protein|nr:hypothetical protein [Acidimicrobiales bacterium]
MSITTSAGPSSGTIEGVSPETGGKTGARAAGKTGARAGGKTGARAGGKTAGTAGHTGTNLEPSTHGGPEPDGSIRFQDSVVLSKGEVFGACQALADADRLLLRSGAKSEASALGDLFELLEARLSH